MQTEEEKCEIKVQSYIWKSSLMYLTGHYEFEIVLKNVKGKNSGQKTVYRRFSDLEILHEGLIKYNPGCRIPPIPEKSIWCNLYVNNDASLEKRKRQIEEYLNYINNHKYLSNNPIFLIFLSDDFERYKIDYNNKSTFYDKISSLKKYLPNLFKTSGRGIYTDDNNLELERDNLMRLDKGLSEIKIILENYLKINEERTDSLKNILNVSKSLEHTNLKLEHAEYDEEYIQMKKSMENNFEIFFNLYDKNKIYCNLLNTNILDSINKYHIEVTGLKEIFERKDKLQELIKQSKNKKDDKYEDNDIYGFKEIYANLHQQLFDEINNFKATREKDLLEIMKKFFNNKYEYDLEVANIFEGNIQNQIKINLDENFKLNSNEDHFR